MPLSRRHLSRRHFLELGVLLGGSALLPPLRAAKAAGEERKFLFLFCRGGWDTSRFFTPMDHISGASIESDATVAEVGGISFVDSASRPLARAWMERYAGQTCLLNGMEVRSVAHEQCRRLLLAGSGGDDWPTLIAAASSEATTLPHLVLAGPNYASRYGDRVVRVGDDGQLGKLLSGEALSASTLPISPLPAEVEALADAWVRERVTGAGVQSLGVQSAAFASRYGAVLDNLQAVQAIEGLSLESQDADCARDVMADVRSVLNCFELGLSRTAMIQYNGWCDQSWDTHNDLDLQSVNYEELFGYLDGVMTELSLRGLSSSVTVVVLSEMGRHPVANNWGGKDHWTVTSAMLIGAGVKGGQVVGALDENAIGTPVDAATGETRSDGVALLPQHLGATLLAMADLDPGDYGLTEPPLTAMME